jgi:hypothetical protein
VYLLVIEREGGGDQLAAANGVAEDSDESVGCEAVLAGAKSLEEQRVS